MNIQWLISPFWVPFIVTLLHTLWQGPLVAGALFAALHLVPARRAHLRYALSTVALGSILLMAAATWMHLIQNGVPADAVHGMPSFAPPPMVPGGPEGFALSTPPVSAPGVQPWVRWTAAFWLVGVVACLARVLRGLFRAVGLRRHCRELTDPHLLALVDELSICLRLSRRVRLLVSSRVRTPSVTGLFCPVVLLPAAMLTGVSVETWRAVLAHELAHVRRHDMLVNFVQLLVEAFLFFNPCVWWISRQMRLEREACCDQLAAGECQSPVRYVEALVAVIAHHARGASRVQPTPLLVAAGFGQEGSGPDGASERVRRLLLPDYLPKVWLHWSHGVAAVLAASAILSAWWMGAFSAARPIAPTPQTAEAARFGLEPTNPHTNKALVFSLTQSFANVPVGDKHLQVMLEKYTNGQKILTVVNGRLRKAPPTPMSALKVHLFRGDGSELQPHPILAATDVMIGFDRGWGERIAENAPYDLSQEDVTRFHEVQLELDGKISGRVKLQGYHPFMGSFARIPAFNERAYVIEQAQDSPYGINWYPPPEPRSRHAGGKQPPKKQTPTAENEPRTVATLGVGNTGPEEDAGTVSSTLTAASALEDASPADEEGTDD